MTEDKIRELLALVFCGSHPHGNAGRTKELVDELIADYRAVVLASAEWERRYYDENNDVRSLTRRLEGTVGQQQYDIVLDDNTRLRTELNAIKRSRARTGE